MNGNILDVTIAPECPHKDCGQIFNESNQRLAIYLNGVFFLVKPGKGIIGFTCPRCQRTVTNSTRYNDILKIKNRLSNSPVEVVSYSESEDGKMLVYPKSSFDSSLNYLSPFMLSAEVINELDIDYFQSSNENDKVFSDQIRDHVEKNPELKDKYCSFAGDANNPISAFRSVYWFDDLSIEACLNYESEHNVRIFSRYHYQTELVEQINSLLGINYFMGKTFQQAKEDHEKEHAQTIERLKAVAYENNMNFEKLLDENNINESSALINIIEQNESRIANDPIIPAQFLKILTSGPDPLGNSLTAGICNYLWAEINPFENRPFPEFFVDEIDDPDLGLQIHKKNKEHITMAKLVQENSNKQYVQDFLKTNVVDFVEEYEGAIQSNEFSYAHLWSLKDSYLAGLHKATLNGLSEQAPYVMKKEGKGWKMVFNGKTMSGLRQIGFSYLYHLICHPNEYFFHADLFIAAGKGMPVSEPKKNSGSKGSKTVKYVDDKGEPVAIRMIDDKGLKDLFDRIEKLKDEIAEAKEFGNNKKALMKEDELQQTRKYLSQVYDKTKKRIRYIKDANLKKVTDSVGKAILRALEDIREEDPGAYQHFANAIGIKNLYQDTLVYRPAPDEKIEWITIG